MPDNIDYDEWEKYTFENRDQQRYSLPHRIIFRIYYDPVESMKQQKHLYHLIPMMEINNGELNTQPLKPFHRQFYRKTIEEHNRQFGKVDFNRLFTVEELSHISAFKDTLDERDKGIRPGFPEDITSEEEQLIYNIIMNVSKPDVIRLFNLEEVKPELSSAEKKDQEIASLQNQVSQLTELVKQLLDKKDE